MREEETDFSLCQCSHCLPHRGDYQPSSFQQIKLSHNFLKNLHFADVHIGLRVGRFSNIFVCQEFQKLLSPGGRAGDSSVTEALFSILGRPVSIRYYLRDSYFIQKSCLMSRLLRDQIFSIKVNILSLNFPLFPRSGELNIQIVKLNTFEVAQFDPFL